MQKSNFTVHSNYRPKDLKTLNALTGIIHTKWYLVISGNSSEKIPEMGADIVNIEKSVAVAKLTPE